VLGLSIWRVPDRQLDSNHTTGGCSSVITEASMFGNPDAYPEMFTARAHEQVRELEQQRRMETARAARRAGRRRAYRRILGLVR
jgi:hypothetical protein